MATTADAEIILKLYDLRREPQMRKTREQLTHYETQMPLLRQKMVEEKAKG